jgi:hypothetical protein
MSGLPAILANGLPGKRVLANLAGMIPTVFTSVFYLD